jgi:hypothetical protein
VCTNTITDIISALSQIQIEDKHLAWQLRDLVAKLYILEGVYDDLHCKHVGISEAEKNRYTEEVFPSILTQCEKLARYFTMCPELRQNQQDADMLKTYFQRYSKIVDRLLVKLQKAQAPRRAFFGSRIKKWVSELACNIREFTELINSRFNNIQIFAFNIPCLFLRRKTVVSYHRDTIDYVGSGYSLQPIQALSFEYA